MIYTLIALTLALLFFLCRDILIPLLRKRAAVDKRLLMFVEVKSRHKGDFYWVDGMTRPIKLANMPIPYGYEPIAYLGRSKSAYVGPIVYDDTRREFMTVNPSTAFETERLGQEWIRIQSGEQSMPLILKEIED